MSVGSVSGSRLLVRSRGRAHRVSHLSDGAAFAVPVGGAWLESSILAARDMVTPRTWPEICPVVGDRAGNEQATGSGRGSLAQLAAFLTNAPIFASTSLVNSFSANEAGHMAPSSSLAVSLKPKVAYLTLNFSAPWKKHKTLSSLA